MSIEVFIWVDIGVGTFAYIAVGLKASNLDYNPEANVSWEEDLGTVF